MVVLNAFHKLLKTRKERFARGKFKALTTTPHNFAGSFVMPAGGKIYVKLGALTAAVTVVLTARGRDISVPALAANKLHPLGYFEKGSVIAPVYAASTMQLFLEDPSGRRVLFASKA